MTTALSDRARQVLSLAEQEAFQMRHHYVGTEHILLGLLDEGTGVAANALSMFGVGANQVRAEIERLIQRRTEPVVLKSLPLTPRAKTAIDIAAEEARGANQKEVDAGHLLLGLTREPDGVAGKVLTNLGLNLQSLREEVLKIRRLQMILVERAVRPVCAGPVLKRKMREELLAHLTGIYEEELALSGSPTVALQAAAERFGDPATLAQELNSTLRFSERAVYLINRSVGWRPPEPVVRYMLRFATGMTAFVAMFLFCCLIPVVIFLNDGVGAASILARPLLCSLPFLFFMTWTLGMLYFKLRDSMCGAPWARKSFAATITAIALIAILTFGAAIAFNAVANVDPARVPYALAISIAVAAVATIAFPIVARTSGPDEIRDAIWAGLDLDDAKPEVA